MCLPAFLKRFISLIVAMITGRFVTAPPEKRKRGRPRKTIDNKRLSK